MERSTMPVVWHSSRTVVTPPRRSPNAHRAARIPLCGGWNRRGYAVAESGREVRSRLGEVGQFGVVQGGPVVAGLAEPLRVPVPDVAEAGPVELGLLEDPLDGLPRLRAQVFMADEHRRVAYVGIAGDQIQDVAVDRRPGHAERGRAPAAVPRRAGAPNPAGAPAVVNPGRWANSAAATELG